MLESESDICSSCAHLERKCRHFRNMWMSAKHKLKLCRIELTKCKTKLGEAIVQTSFYICYYYYFDYLNFYYLL